MSDNVLVHSPLRVRGQIQLTIRHADGRVRRIVVKNTITYAGCNALLFLLAQSSGNAADWKLARLIPGRNATPPTVGDLAVIDPVASPDQVVLTNPDLVVSTATGELVVTGTLQTSQANGSTLREVGLVLANGWLFARQIHPAVDKDSSISITYTWRIAMVSA